MSSKKKTKIVDTGGKISSGPEAAMKTLENFVAAGQAAQAEADKLLEALGPEAALDRFVALVNTEAGKINKSFREYFLEKGMNPFREASRDLRRFEDAFDGLAGQKGISTK